MKRPAFTLTELMVSLLIIGLITTTAVVAIAQVRVKGRDSQRITDIKLLQSALESYYRDENQYPATLNFGQPLVGSSSTSTYLSLVPTSINILDGACTSSSYTYTSTDNNHSYTLQFCLANSTNNANAGYNCATPAGIEKAACSDIWVCGDQLSYGGESYATVQIGSQCWFANNLNLGVRINSSNSEPTCHDLSGGGAWSCQIDPDTVEKYCYNNDADNCTTNGGLYEWAEAMGLPYDCNKADATNNGGGSYTLDCPISGSQTISAHQQGICPVGWHIPTFTEFQILARNADPNCDLNCSGGLCNCTTAGGRIKVAISHTPIFWDGTDDYAFSALPSGYHNVDGTYYNLGNSAYLWSSVPVSTDPYIAWAGYLYSGNTAFTNGYYLRANGFSVRCIKN